MKPTLPLPISNLPEEGLRFFHSLSNWVETSKIVKPDIISWKRGKSLLKTLTFIKPKQGEQLIQPKTLPDNTLYVPSHSSGLYVIRQLRNAFCHNDIIYDAATNQYRINLTDKVKITGQFSLEAIEEFVSVFLSSHKSIATTDK